MSYPTGDQSAPQHGSTGAQRPSFDRPSLFAGMDAEADLDDTPRVRILSTLESSRRVGKPKRNTQGKYSSMWLQLLLWSAMGIGVLALLIGFVMVIQDTQPATLLPAPPLAQANKPGVLATPKVNVAMTSPLQVLSQEVLPATTVSSGPAVIETPQGSNPTIAAIAAPVSTPSVTSQTTSKAAAPEAAKTTAGAKAPDAKITKTRPAAKKPDEDVALLEAMFAHTRGRGTPESVRQEQKQRCGELSGAEAKACRAEVCKTRPSAALCR